ncbi:hypothetical protein CI610_03279 [invertebrate metagenome]|uniref:RING-type domain-containing protein n=1 Tax=invertebrate metagenome TaxID=1711999 RepID=A0A2H9T3J0_9ZZZZ
MNNLTHLIKIVDDFISTRKIYFLFIALLFGLYPIHSNSAPKKDSSLFRTSPEPLPEQNIIADPDAPDFNENCLFGDGTGFYTCIVCFEKHLAGQSRGINCIHLTCSDCLTAYIKSADINTLTRKGLACPANDCSVVIPLSVIDKLAGNPMRRKIHRMIQSIKVNSDEYLIWCPATHCGNVIDIRNASEKKTQCSQCNQSLCITCSISPFHEHLSCTEYQEKQLEEIRGAADIIQCPRCREQFEFSRGCNHITCMRCKTEICRKCKKKINGYSHFRSGRCQGMYDTDSPSFNLFLMENQKIYGIRDKHLDDIENLKVHLQARKDTECTITIGEPCQKCQEWESTLAVIQWDCGHKFCYECGANMFDGDQEQSHNISYLCIFPHENNAMSERQQLPSAKAAFNTQTCTICQSSLTNPTMNTCNDCQLALAQSMESMVYFSPKKPDNKPIDGATGGITDRERNDTICPLCQCRKDNNELECCSGCYNKLLQSNY